MRTGVFFCEMGDLTTCIDLRDVQQYAADLPDVVAVRDYGADPKLDPAILAAEIRKENLERVVVAGDSSGFFKQAFTHGMAIAGRDTDEVHLASFREYCSASGMDTMRAKSIVACAVMAVPFRLAAVPDTAPVDPRTLVIGAGIAGIQASLEIADAGKQVYLVERTSTVGGHMAMFDKTFPTLDCAACILTPKMVAVDQHENIELMTNSEVVAIGGRPGAYTVTIRQKARRVSVKDCVACDVCSQVCPVRVVSEFDNGIAERKAAYIAFPQAVPNAYSIDAEHCQWVQSGGTKCGVCAKKCPKECIDLNQADETREITVGNIILATGYDLYDAGKVERYGYGKLPNVLTSLEFERLTNASGPTSGKIVMRSRRQNKRTKQDEWVFDADSGSPPQSVAIVHCVGSRDANHNEYCSRVCCMYSLKFAHLVREKLPNAHCYEFYIDMRAFGKGYEEFAERIKAEGTSVIRGRTAMVVEEEGRMMVKGEDIISERMIDIPVDMVILAVGLVPAAGSSQLAQHLGIDTDRYGWFSELDYNSDPTDTERGGIFVAGVGQGPKDIPDTVAQASAVAAGVLKSIAVGRGVSDVADLSLEDIEARAAQLIRV
ncbi:MAG: CoB--CoM heterodisulfide reductase iron-sulfur subunit A family protein [Thermoleophilia bacterium]